MRRGRIVQGALFLADFVDLTAMTIFFGHGNDFHHQFIAGTYKYKFMKSTFDIWALGLFRFCILVGLLSSVIRNPIESVARINKLKPVAVCIMITNGTFSIIKLLVKSEDKTPRDAWFWLLFSWSLASSMWFYIHIYLLTKVTKVKRRPLEKTSINDSEADILSTNSEDGQKEDKEETPPKVTIFRLLSYSKPDIPYILLGFLFLLAASVGEIFIPYYTGLVIDSIVIDKSQKGFLRNILMMSAISFGSAIATGLRGGLFSIAMSRLNIRVRNLLFSSLLKQEIGFFDSVKTGDITSRLTSDTTVMSDTVSLNMNVFLRSLVKGIGTLVFMFKLSWQLTLVTVIGLPLVFAVYDVYGNYYQKLSKKVQDSFAKTNDIAEECCSTIRTVRSFANEDGEIRRYSDALQDTYKLYKKEAVAYAGYRWCNQIFELALNVAVLYYGGHLVLTGRMSGGNLVSFILYQTALGNCIDEIGDVYTGLMQAVGASEKVFEYMFRKPKQQLNGNLKPSQVTGKISFNDVSFSYPTRQDSTVLQNVSFSVNPGEVVALVGPSGGGKSSCINLIQCFYETKSGEILLDSSRIQDYDHHFLHRMIALVGQEPVLYARSIAENISYGLDPVECTQDKIEHVAKLANAHDFIMDMKDKYKTQTGEKGMQMSGGQKQRIAIARALMRNPTILLLDEATSALDAESEHVVQQAIYKNLRGRTVIIIAHRLSTVERADRIIVIDKGRVVEQGTHGNLLQQKGLYSQLVQRQLLTFEDLPTSESAQSNTTQETIKSSPSRDIDNHYISPRTMTRPDRQSSGSPSCGSPTFFGS